MLALVSIDYKFILIPLAFILLRVWAFIGDIIHVYFGKNHLNEGISLVLIVLAVSTDPTMLNHFRFMLSI